MARPTFVVVEVALATMLLVSATLVARSLVRLLGVNAGFDPSHLLTLQVDASANGYRRRRRDRRAITIGFARPFGALPGVSRVALTNQVPLAGNVDMYGVLDPDNMPANPELVPSGDRYVVSPEYFATMRIPILRGRAFTEADAADTANKVVLVSAALARADVAGPEPARPPHQARWRRRRRAHGHRRHGQREASRSRRDDDAAVVRAGAAVVLRRQPEMIVVRTTLDPASLVQSGPPAIASMDPTLPISASRRWIS